MLSKFNELKKEKYSPKDDEYAVTVYKAQDSKEIRVNIVKNGEGQNILWTLDDLEISSEITNENELVEKCLALAKSAIDENESDESLE